MWLWHQLWSQFFGQIHPLVKVTHVWFILAQSMMPEFLIPSDLKSFKSLWNLILLESWLCCLKYHTTILQGHQMALFCRDQKYAPKLDGTSSFFTETEHISFLLFQSIAARVWSLTQFWKSAFKSFICQKLVRCSRRIKWSEVINENRKISANWHILASDQSVPHLLTKT